MRILLAELQKLFSKPLLWIVLILTLCMNAYCILHAVQNDPIEPALYRATWNQIQTMTDDEKLAHVTQALDAYWSDAEQSQDSSRIQEYLLLSKWQKELQDLQHYGAYLDGIAAAPQQADNGMFAVDTQSFAYRNTATLPKAYASVRNVVPQFGVSEGVQLATDHPIGDVLCLFVLFTSVYALILSDKEQKTILLLQSTPKGRRALTGYQTLALGLVTALLLLLFFGESLLLAGHFYGLGDLQRPIQSVSGWIGCNLPVSVLEYLMLFFAVKLAAYWLMLLVFALICMASRHNLQVYGRSAAVVGVAYLLYVGIPSRSAFVVLRELNLVGFTQTNAFLQTFRNLNLFGHPVALLPVMLGCCLVVGGLLLAACLHTAQSRRAVEYRNIRLRLPFAKAHRHISFSRFGYVVYHSVVLQKSGMVLAAFCVCGVLMSAAFQKPYSVEDTYYQYYTERFSGCVDVATEEDIAQETERFAQLQSKLEQATQQSDVASLQKQLEPQPVFEVVKTHIRELQASGASASVFYDTGYRRFFDLLSREHLLQLLLSLAFLVLTIAPLLSYHNALHASALIHTTVGGKRAFLRDNFVICLAYGALPSLVTDLPFLCQILNRYGSQGLHERAGNLLDWGGVFSNASVLTCMLLLLGALLLMRALVSGCILWISGACKSTYPALLISSAAFVLPVFVLWVSHR